jgi:hypothetical protein
LTYKDHFSIFKLEKELSYPIVETFHMRKTIPNGISLIVLLICLSILLQGNANGGAVQNPRDLIPVFDNLLAFTKEGSKIHFDDDSLVSLLNFVVAPKHLGDNLTLGKRQGGSSDYYEFTIDRPLREVLTLAFNPNIPAYITAPSTVRLSQWIGVNGEQQQFGINSDILDGSSEPDVIRGIEIVENTPDVNSGSYHSYELDRAVILKKHHGNRVLISTSAQRGISSVGKKALILGSDDDWNYLYTEEEGCTVAGLGWINSYLYDSSAIIVYYETSDPYPQVKYAIFKWIKAGWLGLNFVKPSHLRKGAERYAKAFKEVIESPALRDISEFSETINQIKNLSREELKVKARLHFREQMNRCHDTNNLGKKWFAELFKDDLYLESLTRGALEAIVNLEYLKHLLGKTSTYRHFSE